MNVDLEHLIVLQAQDLEARRLREELAEAPRRVRAAQATHMEAETRRKAMDEALVREEALRRRQGSDADDFRAKLIRLRRQLAAATSAAQISALEHEISFSETAIRKLEDEELDSLGRTETLETDRAGALEAESRCDALRNAERNRAAELSRTYGVTLAALETERLALRAQIGEGPLATYDRVAKGRGTGAAEARDGQCTACRMKVRPQRWNDLTGRDHEEEIFTCETCGRMLFYDPRRNTPGSWAAGDRLAAALQQAELSPASAVAGGKA